MKMRNILYADEGKLLTNGETFGRIVYLAEGESPKNWKEVAAEEISDAMEGELA
jgi:hypothetical protein